MAYTIISQNNTTTTLADENGNVITVPARVTLATSTDYTITKVNNNSVDLVDGNGKVVRGVPACVVLAGEGGGGGSSLPDQTGQNGKFLTTNGTDASWSDKPLVNNTTQTDSIAIGGSASGVRGVAIGVGSSITGNNCLAVGKGASTSGAGATALGYNTNASSHGTSIGANSSSSGNNSISIGYFSVASGTNSIQLGSTGSATTNSDSNTFKVGNENGNFEIMSADGTVPHARLTNAVVSNAITIAVADWNGGTTCTKTISGLTATSVVWVAPDNASQSDYLTAGVYASAQTTDTITFTATTTPTSALTVNVIYC